MLVSQFGLEINEPLNCPAQLDSGVQSSVHDHDVDDEDDTTFAMLSMWNAGLRVFDIRDPEAPVEGPPDDRGRPEIRHPRGRPGTQGADLTSVRSLEVDLTPWYCTLGAVEQQAGTVTGALASVDP